MDSPDLCEAMVPVLQEDGLCIGLLPCPGDAAGRYRYTCPAGHVSERWTCRSHEPVAGDVGCRRCLLEHGQDRPMTFERVSP